MGLGFSVSGFQGFRIMGPSGFQVRFTRFKLEWVFALSAVRFLRMGNPGKLAPLSPSKPQPH